MPTICSSENRPFFISSLVVEGEPISSFDWSEKCRAGQEADTVKDAQLGMVDFSLAASNNISMWYPKLDVTILPMIFRDRFHSEAFLKSALWDGMKEEYRKASGLRIVSVFEWGDRGIATKSTNVAKPSDLQGVKIRLPKNSVMLDTYQALGAVPTAIDFGELYSALQQGLAEGMEAPPQGIIDMKMSDFLKCYSTANVFYGLACMVVNDKKFSSLSPEVQAAILRAGDEAGASQRWASAVSHVDGLERLEKLGVKVTRVTDRKPFRDAVKPVYEKYGPIIGEDVIQQVIDIK
jgi:TRAP-type C4-dicarboxylate transport system substrate-binding protein